MYIIASFYKFVDLDNLKKFRRTLHKRSTELGLRGTFILSREGINGTVAGKKGSVDSILFFLKSDKKLSDIECKFSNSDFNPFYRMKVKIKKELVPLGTVGVKPNKKAGIYVEPEDWNNVVNDPKVLLIDTRNKYEVSVGTFKGAMNPNLDNFVEFTDFVEKKLNTEKNKKIAMFCTGGIRCEKASSFLIQRGFREVYQLRGGILKYLEQIPKDKSIWEGECFVFDNRTSVNHDLKTGDFELCRNCRHPLSFEERKSSYYEEGISCPHCFENLTPQRRASLNERQKQIKLAEKRNTTHLGWSKP